MVTSDLSDNGLSENPIYPMLFCESPSLNSTTRSIQHLPGLQYPTPGLSNTFVENKCYGINQSPLYMTIYIDI